MSRNYQTKMYKQVEATVETLLQNDPDAYRGLYEQLMKYQHKQAKLTDTFRKVFEVMQCDKEVKKQYNDILHPDLRTMESSSRDVDVANLFKKIFETIEKKYPDEYDQTVSVIAEIGKNHFSKDDLRLFRMEKLINVMNVDPSMRALPVIIKDDIIEITNRYLDNLPLYVRILGDFDEREGYTEPLPDDMSYNESESEIKEPKSKAIKSKRQGSRNGGEYLSTKVTSGRGLAKSEANLFQTLSERLEPESYKAFVKLVYLFNNCIISFSELAQMGKHIIGELDSNIWQIIRDMMDVREIPRTKNCLFFKSVPEIDNAEPKFNHKFNQSYRKYPPNFPFIKPSMTSDIAKANVNLQYASCSLLLDKKNSKNPYEEGVLNTKKNIYEEALFKAEDERFEFDRNILLFKNVIRWLEIAADPNTPEERANNAIVKIGKFQKAIFLVYRDKTQEVLQGIQEHRVDVTPKILQRIREKFEILQTCKKDNYMNEWSSTYEKNFHRSLDTRSIALKTYEKKMIVSKGKIDTKPSVYTRHPTAKAEREANLHGSAEAFVRKCSSR